MEIVLRQVRADLTLHGSDGIALPDTEAAATFVCSKSRVTKMPSSSAVRSRKAARRQWCTRRSPSKTPMVTFVLPTSMAKSIANPYP